MQLGTTKQDRAQLFPQEHPHDLRNPVACKKADARHFSSYSHLRPFWDIARAREQSLRIAGADILGREVDSTRLLLAFEYEDVWRSAARNARGYREGLEIGRKFVLLRQCNLAFGLLNHFKGARAEASR